MQNSDTHDTPVYLTTLNDAFSAEILKSQLDALDIPCYFQRASIDPGSGVIGAKPLAPMDIYVPSRALDAARAVLNAPVVTEEELTGIALGQTAPVPGEDPSAPEALPSRRLLWIFAALLGLAFVLLALAQLL